MKNHMKFKVFGLFLFLGIFVFAQEKPMTSDEISALKSKVSSENSKIQTIKTDFIQYKHMDVLEQDIKSEGQMFFKAKNTLKWQYLKPMNYSILFKENKVYINDQGKKQTINANSNKLFEKLSSLIAGSVTGNVFDESEFKITYLKNSTSYVIKLVPKVETVKKYIQEVHLFFPLKEAFVSEVKLIEPSKDYTRIQFKNRQINASIENTVFVP